VFNVQVPRNENMFQRLNTTLRALVELAGDQQLELKTLNEWQQKVADMSAKYWYDGPRLAEENEGLSELPHEC
jgi:hypothetical protein